MPAICRVGSGTYTRESTLTWDHGAFYSPTRTSILVQYVDEAYEGGGIGEYQFWNQANQEWDTTPCNYGSYNNNNNNNKNNNNNNSGEKRCAKMDCHLEDTHWTMLGFFKHMSYNDWFGQLFKHEGYCIWDSDQYSFMKNAKGAWPGGCTQSDKYIGNDESKPIYYDLKPTSGGGITVGLYTDTKCVKEYSSKGSTDAYTIESVLGNFLMNNRGGHSHDNNDNQQQSDLSLSEAMSMWDEYFSIYKICQPCVAHDLDNVGYNGGDKGSAYGTYTYGNDDYYSYYNKGADFDCYDDAGYTNVNQVRVLVCPIMYNCVGHCALTIRMPFGSCLIVHEIHGQDLHGNCHVS